MKNKIEKKLKKSFGQNFLKNDHIAQKITDYVNYKSDIILEIGPGKGALTKYIIKKKYIEYHIVELDEYWADKIKKEYQKDNNSCIVFQKNILYYEFDLNKKYSVVGNIPYNITFPIIMKLIDCSDAIDNAVIMMQEEVAQKLIKKSGSNYGPISILTQLFFDIELLDFVFSREFIPQPKVNSRVVKFLKKTNLLCLLHNLEKFKKFLSYFFVYPRKKIKHQGMPEVILFQLSEEIHNKRAQELDPEFFLSLFLLNNINLKD